MLDDQSRLRWVSVPDDLAGMMTCPAPLTKLVRDRLRFVLVVADATHGKRAPSHLSKTYGLTPGAVQAIQQGAPGSRTQLDAIDLAFQNAVSRVRLMRDVRNEEAATPDPRGA